MNLLINLGTLKKGGGQNVGLNFIQSLDTISTTGINFLFAVSKGSDIHKYLKEKEKELIILPENPLKRMLFEFKNGSKIISKYKIDIIYTIFGIGLYPRHIPQISGSADSNLYFPEIDFWNEYSGLPKLMKKIIDLYRIRGLKRATAVVFENEEMEKRCKQIFKKEKTCLILPSINNSFANQKYKLPHGIENTPKGLFLCGWQRNKNFILIPEMAAHFKENNIDFHFIITAEKDNSYEHKIFMEKVNELRVENMVSIVGKVKKEELKSLYNQIDFVFLLSKLESFSNNIIEAWTFQKPLIISKAAWSMGICKDAALYVDRDNAKSITEKVIDLVKTPFKKDELVNKGIKILDDYPTIKERTKLEINYIREIYENI